MKKQLLSTLLALCMVLTLTACGGKSDTSDPPKDTQQSQSTETNSGGEAADDIEDDSGDADNAVNATTAEAWGECGEDLEWYYLDHTLYIRGTGDMWSADIIGCAPWDHYRDDINKVIVEDGCTSIGYRIFEYHENVSEIELPDSVEVIRDRAFYDCYSLPSIELPDGLKEIGAEAFSYCHTLESIELPDSIEVIEYGTFSNCASLKTIKFGARLKAIGNSVFANCKELKTMEIPGGITTIEDGTFSGSGLASITLPASLEVIEHDIGTNPFGDCDCLEEIVSYSPNYTVEDGMLIETETKTLLFCSPRKDGICIIPDRVEIIGPGSFQRRFAQD